MVNKYTFDLFEMNRKSVKVSPQEQQSLAEKVTQLMIDQIQRQTDEEFLDILGIFPEKIVFELNKVRRKF